MEDSELNSLAKFYVGKSNCIKFLFVKSGIRISCARINEVPLLLRFM